MVYIVCYVIYQYTVYMQCPLHYTITYLIVSDAYQLEIHLPGSVGDDAGQRVGQPGLVGFVQVSGGFIQSQDYIVR